MPTSAHIRERVRVGGGLIVGALAGMAAGSMFDRPSLHLIFTGADGLHYSPLQSMTYYSIFETILCFSRSDIRLRSDRISVRFSGIVTCSSTQRNVAECNGMCRLDARLSAALEFNYQ
jgi:hypothetical protein